jgi:hypothetical protein
MCSFGMADERERQPPHQCTVGRLGRESGGERAGQLPITGNLKTDLKNLFDDSSYKVWLCAHRANTQKGIADGIPENSFNFHRVCNQCRSRNDRT